MQPSDDPTVTVAIPVYNESDHIDRCLEAIERQTCDRIVEVLVVDGESTDDTVERAAAHPQVTVLTNPRRMQAAALNVALGHATGEVFVRVDGHCIIEPDYVERCLRALDSSGASLVGGAMRPRAESWFGRAVARAMTLPIGAGPARFHVGGDPGWVETVYLGAGPTERYRAVGGFSEDVGVNEDTEIAHRMREHGGVWFDPTIRSSYVPRSSLRAVVRQFFRYGLSRAATTKKHPRSLRLRQLAPPLLVLALVLGPRRRVVAAAYGGVVAATAAHTATTDPPAGGALVAIVPAMHLSWGIGFIAGMLGWPAPGQRR